MMRKNSANKTTAVLEITRSTILVTVARPQGSSHDARAREVTWRREATSLMTEAGAAEFTAALKQIVQEEKLAGARVGICLSEDYCVTRVASGLSERVRRELSQLEERSSLYLSLGTGRKSYARAVRNVDARHQHALLSVTNERTLQLINKVCHDLNLVVEVIETSLVALCRGIGHGGRDIDQPVIIVHCAETSFELGISHQGQLLLDYRPAGKTAPAQIAGILAKHLARLDRYCQRYFRFPAGCLRRVLLCGAEEYVAAAAAGFRDTELRLEQLVANELDENLTIGEPGQSSKFAGVLGTHLVLLHSLPNHAPNFMERIKAETQAPFWPVFWRAAWPFVGALAASLLLWVGVSFKEREFADLTNQMRELEPQVTRATLLKGQITHADNKMRHLQTIQKHLSNPGWVELISRVGKCLPDDVWLETILLTEGRLTMSGAGYSEGGIYEFVGYLKQAPFVSQVALEQTTPTQLATGPATRFDVNCDLAGRNDRAKKEAQQP